MSPNTNKDYQALWALKQPMLIGKNLDRGGSAMESLYSDPRPDHKGEWVYPDYRERLRCFDAARRTSMIRRLTSDLAELGYTVFGVRRYDRYQTWDPETGKFVDPLEREKLYFSVKSDEMEAVEIALEVATALSSSGKDKNDKQIYSDAEYVIEFEGPGKFGFSIEAGGLTFTPQRR